MTSSFMYDKKSSMKDFNMAIICYQGIKVNNIDFRLHSRRFEITVVCFCGICFHKKYYNAFFNKFQDKKNTQNNFLLFFIRFISAAESLRFRGLLLKIQSKNFDERVQGARFNSQWQERRAIRYPMNSTIVIEFCSLFPALQQHLLLFLATKEHEGSLRKKEVRIRSPIFSYSINYRWVSQGVGKKRDW